VIAFNVKQVLPAELIHLRVACHPIRLLADAPHYNRLPQALVLPQSMLPKEVLWQIKAQTMYDFGLSIHEDNFEFGAFYAGVPRAMVLPYALALANSGQASHIRLAGFDGYPPGDARRDESEAIFKTYQKVEKAIDIEAITPTCYQIPSCSVYSLIE
jgi:4-hydroxy 2-oxovalerate aldolase